MITCFYQPKINYKKRWQMSKLIITLEEIGKNHSINQYESVQEMIEKLRKDNELIDLINMKNDLVCGMFREDEDEEDEGEEEKEAE